MDGILAKKIGMTEIFDEKGNVQPVTVLQAGPCVVTAIRTKEKHGYEAVQVGFLKKLREFRVDKPTELKIGQEIKVDMFKPGEIVEVTGITIGKGFQGTIKRWHHHRGPMGHGSKSHRLPGSIGAGTTPGRVYKGKRMSGRMGGVTATLKRVTVIRIDAEKNLLLLRGSVPGPAGNIVEIVKA